MQRKMNLSIGFLIRVLFGLVLGGSTAQGSLTADEILDQQEQNLLELRDLVQANALNSCELLSTCNAESTCSRLSCPLTTANITRYECQGVLPNTNCKGNCPWRNFDFTGSVLRVPGVQAVTEDYFTQRQLLGICAQRNLDSFFQKHSNNTNFFRLYFGSVDGTFRIFPGMDEADCSSFDPRTRLWYLISTTNVNKAVMVLIDGGSSMAEIIPSTSDSNLETAFRITESFLNTTTQGDYVNIVTFDNNNVNFSSPQPVTVTDTSSHPDFGVFTSMLSAPNQSSVPSSNITEAISNVITSSAGFGYTKIPSYYLKVIILITDNNAVGAISNVTLLRDLIKNNNISLFIYMFPPSTPAIDASPLTSQLCDARGYFKILDDTTVPDPLLALEAYYSFLANIHSTYVNRRIDYSIQYSDYSEVDNQTFTLCKAVFSNGELLGVVGINIFKTKLFQVYKINGVSIEEAVRKRLNPSSNFNASTGINTTICFNQTSNKTCNQANISKIVCSSNINPDNATLRKLSCCNCTGADKPSYLSLALGLGLGLTIPALIVVVALIAWFFRRRPHQVDEFSGLSGEEEDVR